MVMIPARKPYKRRQPIRQYDDGWWSAELGFIQQAIVFPSIITTTTDYTPTSADFTVLVDASLGARSVFLPQPAQAQFLYLNILKKDLSGNAVTVVGTVSGVVNPTLTNQYDGMTIHCDGVNYYKIGAV